MENMISLNHTIILKGCLIKLQTYNDPKYDEHRNAILNLVKRVGWEEAKYHQGETELDLQNKLDVLKSLNIYPSDFTANMWLEIWEKLKESEEKSQSLEEKIKKSTLVALNADNDMHVPDHPNSSWQLYKKSLVNTGWTTDSINELEETTEGILKKLNIDTASTGPIKGLVIGNVQSGKTANMAGLMAMAADWGWNVFIVLSGSIENLRKQTEERLIKDLDKPGNLAWTLISKPSLQSDAAERTHILHLGKSDSKRYLTVCLKNSTRLANLNAWLKEDENKLKQMRILVIDDEADQAGINTKKVEDDERSRINSEIVNLVNIQSRGASPQSMNYISYTATPYANFLNEAKPESLYPKDFIGVLNPAKEYFGPKQIFGIDDSVDYRGLRIVNEISENEFSHIKLIHKGERSDIPDSLKAAIHWFFCATAVMRYRKYKKPISMLIHTSQGQAHHSLIATSVRYYIDSLSVEKWVELCEESYKKETTNMTLEDFKIDFEKYPFEVNDYPPFERIKDEIIKLKDNISHIRLGDKGKFEYHKGIHLCIDNCANNKPNDPDVHVRLAYPDIPLDNPKYPSPAPAFIVIGGSTLSRGLTIEGLVSTYFLRTTRTADTLMQMGRWFGYRKGYEMLPRIWITKDTKKKFRFLATLDEELRDELKIYSLQGSDPILYGPKIKNSPKVSWLQVTAKNRMQGAIETDLDFSGTHSQTTLFNNNEHELENNIQVTEDFINQLGEPKITKNNSGLYWTNIDFDIVRDFLVSNFKFHGRSRAFNQIEKICEWFLKNKDEIGFTGWNIIVSGKGKIDSNTEDVWNVAGHRVGLVTRSRLKSTIENHPNTINIGVLRAPSDLYGDIDTKREELIPERDRKDFKNKADTAHLHMIRQMAGLGKTPQLIIYRIKKKSTNKESDYRLPLDAAADIIGLNLYIPGQYGQKNVATKLTIKLPVDTSMYGYEIIEGDDDDVN